MSRNLDNKFGVDFLDDIRAWIADNYDPDDVFSNDKLEVWAFKWAKDQDAWIPDPDNWALDHGYTKE